jgi:hypothetical protein
MARDNIFIDIHKITNYTVSPQVKEDEMGRACSTHGRKEKCI